MATSYVFFILVTQSYHVLFEEFRQYQREMLLVLCVFNNKIICFFFTAAAAVHVHGTGSSPKLVRCKISECNNVGLFLQEGAQGVYEDNEISANRLAGVWVKTAANPIMRRNEVCNGKDAGFFIFDGGMVSEMISFWVFSDNIHNFKFYLILLKLYLISFIIRAYISLFLTLYFYRATTKITMYIATE